MHESVLHKLMCSDIKSMELYVKASSKISTDLDYLYTVWKPVTRKSEKYKILFKFLTLLHAM